MGVRRTAKKIAKGASVALATAGLSNCEHGGDPPAPAFQCTVDVQGGQGLLASASLTGSELRVNVSPPFYSSWNAATVTAVVGGAVRAVTVSDPLVVLIELTDGTVSRGSFRLAGTVRGVTSTAVCAVSRTFYFTIGPPGSVSIAEADELPLSMRQRARIGVAAREGREVELLATAPLEGTTTLVWTISGGEILFREGTRLRWRLPAEVGLYQVELVADHGPEGFSYDTLVLEVL